VKNAKLSYEDNLIIITHYTVKICIFDIETKELRCLKGLSPTSNKQINYMIEALNPSKVIDLNEGFKVFPKNHFSRSI
jgi:hypothetical protein